MNGNEGEWRQGCCAEEKVRHGRGKRARKREKEKEKKEEKRGGKFCSLNIN